jgi:hypothetical protein
MNDEARQLLRQLCNRHGRAEMLATIGQLHEVASTKVELDDLGVDALIVVGWLESAKAFVETLE